MNLSFIRLSKLIAEILLVLLVLAAISLGVSRSLFPYIDRYKPYFEQWAAQALHQPVKIGKVQASWQGLYPQLSLEQVEVLNASTQQPLLYIRRLQVGANIVRSLWQHRLVPSSIGVIGARLRIQRLDANTLQVNGMAIPVPASSAGADMGSVVAWLLRQGQIRLEDVDLDWITQEGLLLPLTNLNLILEDGFANYRLIGTGTLVEKVPARFRFVVNISPSGSGNKQVRAECYVYVKNLDLAPWLKDQSLQNLHLKQANVERLQLWAVWERNQWQQLQAVLRLKQALVDSPFTSSPVNLNQLAADISWQRRPTGFSFAAEQIQLQLNQQHWPLTQLSFQQQSATNHLPLVQILTADALDLTQLQTLAKNVVIPPVTNTAAVNTLNPDSATAKTTLGPLLAALQPQGKLQHILMRREVPTAGVAMVSASVGFSGLKTLAWHNLPALDGLQGRLQLTPTAGDLQLAGDSLNINAPVWFDHPLQLSAYQGRIQWLKRADGLSIQADDLNLSDAHLGIKAHLNLWLPQADTPYIQLQAAFSQHDASHLRDYLPTGLLQSHPLLALWLNQAFVAGEGAEGELALQGPWSHFPYDDHSGRFMARVQVKDLTFNYKTAWPMISHLNAQALFEGRKLAIQANSANILGATASALSAQIPDLARGELTVEGSAHADMQQGLAFIAQSPLQKTLGVGLENLRLNGPMQLGLGLHIPLHKDAGPPTVHGQVNILPGAKLEVPAWKVHLTDLAGGFGFTENSLWSNTLSAKWVGQPLSIHITTQTHADDKHNTIEVALNGRANVANIEKEYGLDTLQNKVAGQSDYAALLQLSHNQGVAQTLFSMDSTLQGIAIDLPEPFKKTTDEKLPTHLQMEVLGKADLNVWVQYAKKLTAAITFTQDQQKAWAFKQGNLRFGQTHAQFQTTPGLLVDGYLTSVVGSEVYKYLSPLFSRSLTASSAPLAVRQVNVNIGQLTALGLTLPSATILAQPQANGWLVRVKSPTIAGQLIIPQNLQEVIVGNFERFSLRPGASEAVHGINPGDIPPLNLHFKTFNYADKPFGEVTLVTAPSKNKLQIQRLHVDMLNTHLAATGLWQQTEQARHQTTLSGNLTSDNIGAALKNWQVTSSLLAGRGTAAFALAWPAPAYDFSLKQLNGRFSMAFFNGSIINISDSTEAEMGIGRILNLLSLQSIPRRLSLDFSDLLQKGFAFDQLKGDFILQNGNAFTQNGYLQGPIAKVEIQGRIGLANKDYTLTMATTPYITSSLPLAATILGGPIAGAAVWLGNKVLGRAVNSIATHTYQVSGPWDHPLLGPSLE